MSLPFLYDPNAIADNIKKIAKNKNIVLKDLLNDIGLGANTFSNMRHGRMPIIDNVAKIADYLDCSVDYLLGRTNDTQGQSGVELRVEEYPVIARYRSLSDEGRVVADKLLDKVFEADVVKKNTPTAFSDERIVAILQDRPELTELAEYLRTLNRDQTLQAIGCIQQLLQQQNGT